MSPLFSASHPARPLPYSRPRHPRCASRLRLAAAAHPALVVVHPHSSSLRCSSPPLVVRGGSPLCPRVPRPPPGVYAIVSGGPRAARFSPRRWSAPQIVTGVVPRPSSPGGVRRPRSRGRTPPTRYRCSRPCPRFCASLPHLVAHPVLVPRYGTPTLVLVAVHPTLRPA